MGEKLKTFLIVVAHTTLAFLAAVIGGATLDAFLRPILGQERYQQLARTPLMVVALLSIVALSGAQVYNRWSDRRAFLAWVLPTIWASHLLLSRGMAAMEGKWSDPLFCFGVGTSYSLGAFLAASVVRKTFQKPPVESSHGQ